MCSQVLKWSFLTPREEFVDQLKNQMTACVAKWLLEDLFHTDFQKHIKAISTMMEVREKNYHAVVHTIKNIFTYDLWLL